MKPGRGLNNEGWVKVPSSESDGSLDIGGIAINVKQGDITESKDDCIVNSSNKDLDLSIGAVAKALVQKGGEKLRKEAIAKAPKMMQHQVAMTSAPGLPCQHIIHVVAQDNEADWKAIIEKCLQLADDKKIESVSFPALGTGLKVKPKESARMILKSISQFVSQRPKYLKEINFVIYQSSMVKEFRQEVTTFSTEKSAGSSMFGAAWNYVKGAIGGKSAGSGGDSAVRQSYISRQMDPNEVNFIFYSLSISNIENAIKRLEKIIDNDILNKELKDSYIKSLNPDQVRELKAMADGKQVQLDIKSKQGHLNIAGLSKNVLEFTDKVQVFLRDIERTELQKNHAEMLKNVVQWYYIEITEVRQNLVAYVPQLNFMIEQAFKNQKPSCQFKDTDNITYIVDFNAMEEYPENDKTDTCAIVRRDLIKESTAAVPETWIPMNSSENLKIVTLQTIDTEYQKVAQDFKNTCGANYNVTKIDRIQNVTLYQQYQAKKALLENQNAKGTKNEQILWHGTAAEAVDSINAHGFNRSYCGKNATAFGDGVYFAVQASYSCSNTYSRPDVNGVKRMYLCRVLTGEFVLGKQGMRVPPQKPSAAATHALYDSVVNNIQNPSMFIIFNDTQAYPDYLVTFKP